MKKGFKTLIAGIVLLVIGGFVAPALIIMPFVFGESDEKQFIIPGEFTVEAAEPGRYYLWNDYQTVFEGKSYNRSEAIPDGLEITIRNSAGDSLKFNSQTSITTSSGSNSSKSIGYVDLEQADRLTVSVSGDAEPQVFSFSKSIVFRIVGLVIVAIVLSVLVGLAGTGLIIWGIIKLATDKSSE